jgi:hypothetical protein
MFYINEDESGRRIDCNDNPIFNNLTLYVQNILLVKEINNSIKTHKSSPYVGLLTKNLTTKLADEIAPYFDLEPGFSCTYDHDGFVKTPYLLNRIIKDIITDAASQKFQIALNKYRDL